MAATPSNLVLVGSGLASKAIQLAAESLRLHEVIDPEIIHARRGEPLPEPKENSIACITNPHALHAETILSAYEMGYRHFLAEKPIAVTVEQLDSLNNINAPVHVLHGYRYMWGPQQLIKMVEQGDFGKIVEIRGQYLQAWAAHDQAKGITPEKEWRDDPKLSGEFDTYLDLATHWADLVCAMSAALPEHVSAELSYVNAPSPHRDTHVQLKILHQSGVRSYGTISKTAHGSTNDIDITIRGEKASAGWSFQSPDEIWIGKGFDRQIIRRDDYTLGSGPAVGHGLGWHEGYVEGVKRACLNAAGIVEYPSDLNVVSAVHRALLTGEIERIR